MTNSRAGKATVTTQESVLTSDDTTTSTSYEITNITAITLTITAGKSLVISHLTTTSDTAVRLVSVVHFDDGATLTGDQTQYASAIGELQSMALSDVVDSNGSVMTVYFKVNANTGTLKGTASNSESKMTAMEIS